MPIFGKQKKPGAASDQLASIRDRLTSMHQRVEVGEVPADLVSQMTKDELLLYSSKQRRAAPKKEDESLPQRVDHRHV